MHTIEPGTRRPRPSLRLLPCLLSIALCASPVCGGGLAIGVEYCTLDNPKQIVAMATALGELGVPAAKHFAEAVQWGQMQPRPDGPLDFTKLDAFVREYQAKGFRVFTVTLMPHNPWASRRPGFGAKVLGLKDATPKPEHAARFESWIQSVVERYDADGVSDMPGLKSPITYLEIGSEFSTYEPEPVDSYLDTLGRAYRAAHRAYDGIRVAHAAFLPTPANLSRARTLPEFTAAFAASPARDRTHGLDDMRRVLDHPELFDVLNLHPLGEPYEIEHVMRWLALETAARGYEKDVIASDTTHTMYIGWGQATTCKGRPAAMGVMVPPATEADRCRLAEFFTKLTRKDATALAWTRGFVAGDHVQRTVIAAEQGLKLINLSFTVDLPLLTTPLGMAGAGLSAWGGMLESGWFGELGHQRYPNFYAIQQLGRNLSGYDSIRRVAFADPRVRVYEYSHEKKKHWVGWLDAGRVVLPEDPVPRKTVPLAIGRPQAVLEPVITVVGQTAPSSVPAAAPGGTLSLELSPTPVFVR